MVWLKATTIKALAIIDGDQKRRKKIMTAMQSLQW
jgi:hypothetical protein